MPDDLTIADRIRKALPSLPDAERRVGRVLLANYPVAGLETIARLASRSGTSGPTVLRLTGRLGLASYSELQQLLRDEVDARQRSPLELYGSSPDFEEEGVQAGAAKIFSEAVTRSLNGIEQIDFDQAVNLMATAKARIYTTGGRFSGVLAEYLATHLQELRPGVTCVRMGDRVPALLDIARRDVVIAFDFRRYQQDVINFGRSAAKRGARLILVTDRWMSPLSAAAKVVLTAEVTPPSLFNSIVPATALVETLVAGVVAALGDLPKQRLALYDDLWKTQFRDLHG